MDIRLTTWRVIDEDEPSLSRPTLQKGQLLSDVQRRLVFEFTELTCLMCSPNTYATHSAQSAHLNSNLMSGSSLFRTNQQSLTASEQQRQILLWTRWPLPKTTSDKIKLSRLTAMLKSRLIIISKLYNKDKDPILAYYSRFGFLNLCISSFFGD